MSVDAGQARIQRAAKDLLVRWETTRSVWRDDVSNRFDDIFMTPLAVSLRAAEEALNRMGMILQQLHQDCT